LNFLGHDLPLPSGKSFEKTRQFLIDCPPSSNKDCLRLFIRKYGDKINSETTAMVLAMLFEGMDKNK
jgi:hypothetical protein